MRRRWIWIAAALIVLSIVVLVRYPAVGLRLAERLELYAAGLHRERIFIAGHHIEYVTGGSGEPLVLLHGFGADKSNWVRVAKFLTPHFTVVAPDLPGFGETTRDPNVRYGLGDQVERVHQFVQALGHPKIHAGGNSMGGMIAGAYAARYPNEVTSLWLLAPGGVHAAKRSELDERIAAGDNPLFVRDAEGFERLLDFAFVERPAIPRPIAQYLAEEAIRHRPFNEKILKDMFAEPLALEDVVRGLPTPTLISWGDHDRLCDVSGAAVLKSVMPNAELAVMADVGHVPMVEKPAETAKAFLEFRGVR